MIVNPHFLVWATMKTIYSALTTATIFQTGDMSAIINVAGNYKDGEDIGTFGIGFVKYYTDCWKDDGAWEAIINDYAGPIIFSWKRFFN